MSRAPSLPDVNHDVSTRSRLIVDGNFGAAPKPPHSWSKLAASACIALSSCASPGSVTVGRSLAVREMASRRASVFFASSSRRFDQASEMASISRTKLAAGKYVPP